MVDNPYDMPRIRHEKPAYNMPFVAPMVATMFLTLLLCVVVSAVAGTVWLVRQAFGV